MSDILPLNLYFDAAKFRVDQGIDPYGRKVNPCFVGAAISRPQTNDPVQASPDAKMFLPVVGDGALDVPHGGNRRFALRPGECTNRHRTAGRSGTPAPTETGQPAARYQRTMMRKCCRSS